MCADQLTLEADRTLKNCDVIIGAGRMLQMAEHYHKPTFCSYNYPAITDYMLSHPEYQHFAVLFSGDIGFYSARFKQKNDYIEEVINQSLKKKIIPAMERRII